MFFDPIFGKVRQELLFGCVFYRRTVSLMKTLILALVLFLLWLIWNPEFWSVRPLPSMIALDRCRVLWDDSGYASIFFPLTVETKACSAVADSFGRFGSIIIVSLLLSKEFFKRVLR